MRAGAVAALGQGEVCEFILGFSIPNPREGMHPRRVSTFCSCELAALPANTQLQLQPAQQNGRKRHGAAGGGEEVEAHRGVMPPLAPEQ